MDQAFRPKRHQRDGKKYIDGPNPPRTYFPDFFLLKNGNISDTKRREKHTLQERII